MCLDYGVARMLAELYNKLKTSIAFPPIITSPDLKHATFSGRATGHMIFFELWLAYLTLVVLYSDLVRDNFVFQV